MITIAVNSIKGGVGKTTIAVNLGAALAAEGYRVLLIDTDPQGHISLCFGLNSSLGLWDVMVGKIDPVRVIQRISDRIHVLPSDRRTAALEQQLVSVRDRSSVLSRRLEGMRGYDFVLVDTAPSLSLVLQNAIVYTHGILIPISISYLSLMGAVQALELARMMQEEMRVYYDILGIIPNFVDEGVGTTHPFLNYLDSTFRTSGIRIFSPIHMDVKLETAFLKRRTILEYAPESEGSRDFKRLARELVRSNIGRARG